MIYIKAGLYFIGMWCELRAFSKVDAISFTFRRYQALQKEHDATVTQLDLAQAALEAGGNGARGNATSPGGRESTSGGDVAALQQQL